jgi:hypothetical protein
MTLIEVNSNVVINLGELEAVVFMGGNPERTIFYMKNYSGKDNALEIHVSGNCVQSFMEKVKQL